VEREKGKSPMPNYQLPITNYQLPITNYQLPITNAQSFRTKDILSEQLIATYQEI